MSNVSAYLLNAARHGDPIARAIEDALASSNGQMDAAAIQRAVEQGTKAAAELDWGAIAAEEDVMGLLLIIGATIVLTCPGGEGGHEDEQDEAR